MAETNQVPSGRVFRLTVEPQWGMRGRRVEYEFFFPAKLNSTDTRNFLDSQKLGGMHHFWTEIPFGKIFESTSYH